MSTYFIEPVMTAGLSMTAGFRNSMPKLASGFIILGVTSLALPPQQTLESPVKVICPKDNLFEARVPGKLLAYLRGHVDAGTLNEDNSNLGIDVLRLVCNETQAINPNAGVGPNGELLLSWKKDGHYLALEINSEDDLFEWFYTDPAGRDQWVDSNESYPIVSDKVRAKLNDLFA